MRLTIEISDRMFEHLKNDRIKNGSIAAHVILDAVKNGTSLSEGHEKMSSETLIEQLDSIVPKNPKSDWSKYQRGVVDATIEALKSASQEAK